MQELRYAIRTFMKAPGFTLLTGLILALGIGASVTMFSVMNAVLWRPLPYPEADRLTVIEAYFGQVDRSGISRDAAGDAAYLRLTGTTLLRGRDFNDEDIAARRYVAIVDERFARTLSSGDPIGQRFRIGARLFDVIGVTPSLRVTRVREEPRVGAGRIDWPNHGTRRGGRCCAYGDWFCPRSGRCARGYANPGGPALWRDAA
jgi:MacB-like protein